MKKKIVWLTVSCLMVVSLVLASCAPAVVEEEEGETIVTPGEEGVGEGEVVAEVEVVEGEEDSITFFEALHTGRKKFPLKIVESIVQKLTFVGPMTSRGNLGRCLIRGYGSKEKTQLVFVIKSLGSWQDYSYQRA